MKSYAKALPIDKDGSTMQQHPAPVLSLARSGGENATASSVITLTDNTTAIEVAAQSTAAAIRWVAANDTQASVVSAVSGTNYDHIIPANMMRRFVVPIESMPQSSTVGANVQNGLYKRVALKSIGVGSVLLAEF